jgi:transposase
MSVATDMGVSIRTVHKWVDRYRSEGEAGLMDRSSRPHQLRRPTPTATRWCVPRWPTASASTRW